MEAAKNMVSSLCYRRQWNLEKRVAVLDQVANLLVLIP